MKKLSASILALCVSLFTWSCNDDHGPASIAIQAPTEGQVFSPGQTFTVSATITSTTGAELHGYNVYVVNKATNAQTCAAGEVHVHGTEIPVSQTCNNTFPSGTEASVVVISVNDHDGNTTTKTVNIRFQ